MQSRGDLSSSSNVNIAACIGELSNTLTYNLFQMRLTHSESGNLPNATCSRAPPNFFQCYPIVMFWPCSSECSVFYMRSLLPNFVFCNCALKLWQLKFYAHLYSSGHHKSYMMWILCCCELCGYFWQKNIIKICPNESSFIYSARTEQGQKDAANNWENIFNSEENMQGGVQVLEREGFSLLIWI